jgi:hypothetical protein
MRLAEIDESDSLTRKRRRVDDFNAHSPSYLPQQQPQYFPFRSADHPLPYQSAQNVTYSTGADGGPLSSWPCPRTAEIDDAIEDESLTGVEDVDLSPCCFGMAS